MTSHSPASSPELPKLPDLPLDYYAADHVRAYATSYGLACYEAGRASHAAPTVPVDAVAKDVAERVVKAIEQAYNDTEQSVPRDFCGEATDAAYGAVMDALTASMASRAQTEWISVEDRLPAKYEEVWIANFDDIQRAFWEPNDRKFMVSDVYGAFEEAFGVTHWMIFEVPGFPALAEKTQEGQEP